MRIAVFHNLPIGGAKRVLYEQVKGLSKNNEVEIFTYKSNIDKRFNLSKFAKIKKFKVKTKFSNRLHRDYYLFFGLDNVNKKIAKEINSSRFDVCLVHADMQMEAPHILKYLKKPSLLYDQEMLGICYLQKYKFKAKVDFLKKTYEYFFRLYLKKIDQINTKSATKVVANSNFLKKFIKRIYDIEAKFVYPAVDTKKFKPFYKVKKDFLFVGNKGEYENRNMVKSALRMVNKKYPKLKLITASKNKSKFRINNDKDLSKAYSRAIATICTYSGETFGLKAVESMACETPVIAINEVVYPEVVLNNKTGFLINNEKELAEKMIKLIENPKIVQNLGKAGRKHVLQYSWKNHVQKLERMLTSLANGED